MLCKLLTSYNRLLNCGSKELFPYCLSLFRRGSFKVSGAEKESWMRILRRRFAILEMVGADSRFLAPFKICQTLSYLRNPMSPLLFIFVKSVKN